MSSKIELDKIKPLDVWAIIDTYFRDNPDYKSRHHIDSFNELISSKTNGIEYIIKRENPQLIYKEEENGKYRYHISIYYGETLDEKGEVKEVDKNLFISSPIEYDNDKSSYMYPNIARLKKYTYASSILCNIGVILTDTKTNKSRVRNFEKVNIGTMPIMVKSNLCILNGLDDVRLTELGECPYDKGGYFIINGKEKIFLSQEKKINNILYINSQSDEKSPLQGTIKTLSTKGFQSSRTNNISLNRVRLEYGPSNKELAENSSRHVYRITVRIKGIVSEVGNDFKIPLFVLFRALGVTSDKQIIEKILYDDDSPVLKREMMELLDPSIRDGQMVYTQKDAYKLLLLYTKQKETINVIEILKNNFFPNYHTENEKAFYLGYTVRNLLLTRCKVYEETDRDSYAYKRVDLAGSMLLELYRELWAIFVKNVSLKIDYEYKWHFKLHNNDITNIVNDDNQKKIFNSRHMDNIVKSFGSIFGTKESGRQGIIQDLNRNVMLGTLSHTRRLSYPLAGDSKSLGPRKLHNSQWGFVCPTESPDGGNVGIINHLSIVALVSFSVSDVGIYEALIDHGLMDLDSLVNKELCDSCKIFINGKWVGNHRDAEHLYYLMRLLKLNSIIHLYTSIRWDTEKNEMYLFTDSGRLLRPIFVLKQIGSILTNELIEGDYSYAENWNRLIRGYMYSEDPELSIYDETYHREKLMEIKRKYPDYMTFLRDNQSQIEYIDSMETEGFLISKDIYSIDKEYTHCEIHSSLILSAVALNIPFPEHSQYPRNVFSCQQTKAAVGMYSSAFNTRFDTFAHILNYPQKPIVTTRYKKYTDVDKLPYGINAIISIASYTGYNQEDAVIINKTSLDRGMFQSLYYRSYFNEEEDNNGQKVEFGNPKYRGNISQKIMINFDKLDENGFVREGEYVDSNDAIVGKCGESLSSENEKTTSVSGGTVKFGTSGIVDKVVVTKNKNNLRNCAVRIRKSKRPELGDKFSTRPGLKGVCGMILEQADMPFSKDGIVPDIILNPHGIPKRMTVNQLIEMILGKSACMGGYAGDATPFMNNDINDYAKLMNKYGYDEWGDEVLYSGITGEQMKTKFFIGPAYYQRLKYMVVDKMHSRATGPLQNLTKQPAAGRANNGGLRIGEMERDSILAHGISSFLNESMMERSDQYSMNIDQRDGLITHELDENTVRVNLPYATKLLIQELQGMNITARLITDDQIQNKDIFNELMNNFQL